MKFKPGDIIVNTAFQSESAGLILGSNSRYYNMWYIYWSLDDLGPQEVSIPVIDNEFSVYTSIFQGFV